MTIAILIIGIVCIIYGIKSKNKLVFHIGITCLVIAMFFSCCCCGCGCSSGGGSSN